MATATLLESRFCSSDEQIIDDITSRFYRTAEDMERLLLKAWGLVEIGMTAFSYQHSMELREVKTVFLGEVVRLLPQFDHERQRGSAWIRWQAHITRMRLAANLQINGHRTYFKDPVSVAAHKADEHPSYGHVLPMGGFQTDRGSIGVQAYLGVCKIDSHKEIAEIESRELLQDFCRSAKEWALIRKVLAGGSLRKQEVLLLASNQPLVDYLQSGPDSIT